MSLNEFQPSSLYYWFCWILDSESTDWVAHSSYPSKWRGSRTFLWSIETFFSNICTQSVCSHRSCSLLSLSRERYLSRSTHCSNNSCAEQFPCLFYNTSFEVFVGMGQEISISKDFNTYRRGVLLPSWFDIVGSLTERFNTDHDINVLEVRNVVSSIRDQKLLDPHTFHIPL